MRKKLKKLVAKLPMHVRAKICTSRHCVMYHDIGVCYTEFVCNISDILYRKREIRVSCAMGLFSVMNERGLFNEMDDDEDDVCRELKGYFVLNMAGDHLVVDPKTVKWV